jgi:hypothetical protein
MRQESGTSRPHNDLTKSTIEFADRFSPLSQLSAYQQLVSISAEFQIDLHANAIFYKASAGVVTLTNSIPARVSTTVFELGASPNQTFPFEDRLVY